MRVWICAGEASGDILGGRLMAALREAEPGIAFAGVGGERMAEQGLESLFPMRELALMGLLEVLPRDAEEEVVGYLGPDLLGPDWDAEEVLRRIRAAPDRAIGLALLDQRNLAGVGNVYRNELCFLRGVLPTRPVGAVPDLPRMVELAKRALEANKNRGDRTLTGDTRRGMQDWVYGRTGRPCRRCGTPVRGGTLGDAVRPGRGATDRETYWCPRCQT